MENKKERRSLEKGVATTRVLARWHQGGSEKENNTNRNLDKDHNKNNDLDKEKNV